MPRRTREKIRLDNRPKNVSNYIQKNKFLRESKYHKNNYWSWAAWDSWAAEGKAGGCGVCGEGHYNATLKNKRSKTKRGNRNKKWPIDISTNICSSCVKEIHLQLETEFKKT